MAYIFLDESGDLGFDFSKKKTSQYFIISFLFIGNEKEKKRKEKKATDKIIKKIFNGFSKKEIKFHPNTLHAYKEKPKTRDRVFNLLNEREISIISIYLNKNKVYTHLQDEKQVLYNYVTNILLDRVCTKKLIPLNEKIYLIASRRETNKFLNENFKSYLEKQTKNNHKVNIEIQIKTPQEEKCLQIIDFICWAIYRKYEHNDESYYNLFKKQIIEENPLFS